jgi:hypothetical protein
MLSEGKKLKQYKHGRDKGHHRKRLERRLFLLFSENFTIVFDFLTLQDKHNIPTLSVNI